MGDRSPLENENELELANKLVAGHDDDESVSDSFISQLSPAELEEFRQARECLALLQFAAPEGLEGSPVHDDIENESTAVDRHDGSTGRGTPLSEVITGTHVPNQLGRFEILRELGRGGFGIVLLGRDRALDRLVALKIPRTENLLFPESSKRFEREARAAAVLGHPAIIPIFESGRIGPLTYIAFEFCDGRTLSDWIAERRKPVEPALAAAVACRIADALQHAHSRGVIHRDLKPANIMLAGIHKPSGEPSSEEIVQALRITDFGLARIESDNESLTREGAVIGTPAYMAPEQAMANTESGAPVDIYSTGVILYELLTGKVPFTGRTNVEVINALTSREAVAPRRVDSSIPRDLSAICLKCLAKDPARRYLSGRELCSDLENFLEGRPVSAREATLLESCLRWCSRNPLLSGMVAALFIVLAVSTAVMTALWMNAEDARRTAEFHETQSDILADQSLRHSRRLREAINSLLTSIADQPSLRSKDMEGFRAELLASARQLYAELRDDIPDDEELLEEYLETMHSLAEVLLQLDNHNAVVEICDEAIAILNQGSSTAPVLKSRFLNTRATSLSTTGDYSGSLDNRMAAIELHRELADRHPERQIFLLNLANELDRAAVTALSNGDLVTCRELNEEAIEVLAPLSGVDPLQWEATPVHFEILTTQSQLLSETGNPGQGKASALRALEMFAEIFEGLDHADSATLNRLSGLHFNVGVSGSYSGEFSLSEHHYDRSIEILKVLCERHSDVGKYHQDLISKQYSRALIHFFQHEYDDALKLIETNISMAREGAVTFPGRIRYIDIDLANSLNLKYGIHSAREENSAARDALEEAIRVVDGMVDSGHRGTRIETMLGNFHANLGLLENTSGNLEAALSNNWRAFEILKPIVERQPEGEAAGYLLNACIGGIMASDTLAEYEKAIELGDCFISIAQPDDPRVVRIERARVYWIAATGEYDESLRLLDELVETDPGNVESGRADSGGHCLSLAKSASRCAGFIDAEEAGSAEHARYRNEFVDRCVELIRQYSDKPEDEAQLATVLEDPAFDAVRTEEAFIALTVHFADDPDD